MKEIWKEVISLEREYLISNLGRLKELKTGNIKNILVNKDGYLMYFAKKKNNLLHRLVAEAFIPNGDKETRIIVDHINRNILDNRISNLRWCTNTENLWNSKKMKRKNAIEKQSVYKGISWDTPTNRWIARIGMNGGQKHLGRFHDEVEAAKIYNEMAKKLFGDFAYLNPV